MQIQVNTDNQTHGTEAMIQRTESVVESALERFAQRITRVEVHIADENSSSKSGDMDKHCMIEARLAGLQPISVSHEGASVDEALDGAADKMVKMLDSTLGRLDDKR